MYFRNIDNLAAVLHQPAEPGALTRRTFLKLTSIAGAGLALGAVLPGCSPGADSAKTAAASGEPLTQPFVRIAPDNTVTVIVKHVEAGQGVWTGLSAVVAEELDASWTQMRAEGAPAQVPQYGNFAFDPKGSVQGTGGSTSMANSWQQLREAGATARAMLVGAAAQRWKVPANEITVSEGVVSHASSGKKATFGELAGDASKQAVPKEVKLKDPSEFKLIGREQAAAPRQSGEVDGQAAVRHRRDDAGDDDGSSAASSAFRRQGADHRRCGRESGAGCRGRREDSAGCCCRREGHVLREERA